MKRYCIRPDSTLIECLKVIDANAAGIALAVDDAFRLIGTVSDGDIRRSLLQGHSLETEVFPFINQNCFCVLPTVARAEVLDIMQYRRFKQVPIVDNEKRLVGLHQLHDLLGNVDRPNWAVIMAGGEGTRLRPITERVPKPMIKIAGRPILERLVLHCVHYGIRKIFISVNYLSDMIESYFEDGKKFGCEIIYLRETEPLGTGGSLSLIDEKPDFPVIVMNGDLITEVDLHDMIQFHEYNRFFATMAVHLYTHRVPYGCVSEEDGKITELNEKPIIYQTVNAGVYIVSPEAIEMIPKGVFFHITRLFQDAVEGGRACGAFRINKEWMDIGTPKELSKAMGK